MTDEERDRYERIIFALGQLFGGLSDSAVREALSESLMTCRLFPNSIQHIRDWCTEILLGAGLEEDEPPCDP